MTKTMRVLIAVAAVALMVVAFGGTAQAASLVVNNPSFETPALDPGGSADITGRFSHGGWVQEYGDGTPSAWRPDAGDFPGSPDALPSPADGSQVLSGITGEIAVVQLLSYSNPVLGLLEPDTTYTLTVAVGVPTTTPDGFTAGPGQKTFSGVTIGLADNDSSAVLGGQGIDNLFQVGLSNYATGVVFDYSFSFNSNDVIDYDTVNPGDALALFLDCGGTGTVIDNVRVTAVSTVPEPSTLVLLAAGVIGLLAYAWRKRK